MSNTSDPELMARLKQLGWLAPSKSATQKTGADLHREATAVAKDQGIAFEVALQRVSTARSPQRYAFTAPNPNRTAAEILTLAQAMMAEDRSLTFEAAVEQFA